MKVNVNYIFSRNDKIGSFIIRNSTKQLQPEVEKSPSHVAILVNNKYVIESTLESGFRVIPYKKWLELNEELYKFECAQTWMMKEIKQLYKPLKNKKYDFKGVLYFSWRIILNLFFRIEMPLKNKWHQEDRYFCCEVLGKMTGVSYEMVAPVQLVYRIKNAIDEFKVSN